MTKENAIKKLNKAGFLVQGCKYNRRLMIATKPESLFYLRFWIYDGKVSLPHSVLCAYGIDGNVSLMNETSTRHYKTIGEAIKKFDE